MNPFRNWCCIFLFGFPVLTYSQETPESLTVTTWGGSYEKAQFEAFINPFMEKTGIHVNLKEYSGGLAKLRKMKYIKPDAWKDSWDVLDMTESDTLAACGENLLAKFDSSSLPSAPDGTPAADDFLEDSFLECGVLHLAFSTVLAFDDRAFPGEKPNSVADFFDLKKFPGKRALKREPKALIEWALLSYGVPIEQLYDLLSTDRGMRLVSRRLDKIRDHIVWWEKGDEPVNLLKEGTVVMASGYNGRFFDARVRHKLPITIIDHGQFLESSAWGISSNSPNKENSKKFIEFATRTESMAALTRWMPYGPTRESAFERIGLHAEFQVPMLSHMPTAANFLKTSIRADSEWYAETEPFRKKWFRDWLKGTE